jgi:hypothetical protein
LRRVAQRALHNAGASLHQPLRVPGKFVPEAVEIDALAAGDQPLHALTTEAKLPHGGILCDLIPGFDAAQRRIDRHPSASRTTERTDPKIKG